MGKKKKKIRMFQFLTQISESSGFPPPSGGRGGVPAGPRSGSEGFGDSGDLRRDEAGSE